MRSAAAGRGQRRQGERMSEGEDVEDLAKGAAEGADRAAQEAADSTWFERASRAGFVANGIVHALIGVMAIGLAIGRSDEADQSGAIEALVRQPFGHALVWLCLLGCALLALWNLVNILFGSAPLRGRGTADPRESDGRHRWKEFALGLGRATAYAAVAATFAPFVLGSGGDSGRRAARASTLVASAPGGTVLLVLIGLGIAGAGIGFCVQAVRRSWRKRVRRPSSRPLALLLAVSASAGYAGKGAMLLAVGVLVVVSAMSGDPQESTGVDGALRSLREQPFGPSLLVAIGAAVVAYGIFLVLRARYDRME